MKYLFSLVVILGMGSVYAIDPLPTPVLPTINLPATMSCEKGDFVIIRPTTNGKVVVWYLSSYARKGLSPLPPELNSDKRVLIAVAKTTGKFQVIAYTSLGDIPSEPAECVVEVISVDPTPPIPVPPGPTPVPPTPEPPPTPPAKAWVVIIEDTATASTDRGRWISDHDLTTYITSKSWKVRIADKDVKDVSGKPPDDLKPYLDRVSGKTLPYVFVVDDKGKVRYSGTLSGAPSDFLTILKKIGG